MLLKRIATVTLPGQGLSSLSEPHKGLQYLVAVCMQKTLCHGPATDRSTRDGQSRASRPCTTGVVQTRLTLVPCKAQRPVWDAASNASTAKPSRCRDQHRVGVRSADGVCLPGYLLCQPLITRRETLRVAAAAFSKCPSRLGLPLPQRGEVHSGCGEE